MQLLSMDLYERLPVSFQSSMPQQMNEFFFKNIGFCSLLVGLTA